MGFGRYRQISARSRCCRRGFLQPTVLRRYRWWRGRKDDREEKTCSVYDVARRRFDGGGLLVDEREGKVHYHQCRCRWLGRRRNWYWRRTLKASSGELPALGGSRQRCRRCLNWWNGGGSASCR